jgi:hypothetical protein
VSQRRHWNTNVIGVVPAQLPLDAVSVLPCCAVPEIEGAALLVGALSLVAASPIVANATIATAASNVTETPRPIGRFRIATPNR